MTVTDARDRILAVARDEFARRGFAGARVDEIARKAGVNKALIYYYFQSKKELLLSIIGGFFRELLDLKTSLAGGSSLSDPDHRRRAFLAIYNFFRARKPVIRIVLTEMAKGEEETGEIIRMLEPLTGLFAKEMAEMGHSLEPADAEFMMNITFYGFIPMVMFVTLEDKMADYLAIDADCAAQRFHDLAALTFESFRTRLSARAG